MLQELIYTSAKQGLASGVEGFCTVAATRAISKPLHERLENLSAYRPLFPHYDKRANQNPVAHCHWITRCGGKSYHILSRVAFAGADYTGRSNKLAHHLVVPNEEKAPGGPAWILSHGDRFVTQWGDNETPHYIDEPTALPKGDIAYGPCVAWKTVAGDAGWAGVVADAYLANPNRQIVLGFKAGTDMLPLLKEALMLIPPARRWEVTFSTYFTQELPGVRCQWRCVARESDAWDRESRLRGVFFLDLTRPLGAVKESSAAIEQARSGQVPQSAPKERRSPPKATARSAASGEEREKAESHPSVEDRAAPPTHERAEAQAESVLDLDAPTEHTAPRSRKSRPSERPKKNMEWLVPAAAVLVFGMAGIAFIAFQNDAYLDQVETNQRESIDPAGPIPPEDEALLAQGDSPSPTPPDPAPILSNPIGKEPGDKPAERGDINANSPGADTPPHASPEKQDEQPDDPEPVSHTPRDVRPEEPEHRPPPPPPAPPKEYTTALLPMEFRNQTSGNTLHVLGKAENLATGAPAVVWIGDQQVDLRRNGHAEIEVPADYVKIMDPFSLRLEADNGGVRLLSPKNEVWYSEQVYAALTEKPIVLANAENAEATRLRFLIHKPFLDWEEGKREDDTLVIIDPGGMPSRKRVNFAGAIQARSPSLSIREPAAPPLPEGMSLIAEHDAGREDRANLFLQLGEGEKRIPLLSLDVAYGESGGKKNFALSGKPDASRGGVGDTPWGLLRKHEAEMERKEKASSNAFDALNRAESAAKRLFEEKDAKPLGSRFADFKKKKIFSAFAKWLEEAAKQDGDLKAPAKKCLDFVSSEKPNLDKMNEFMPRYVWDHFEKSLKKKHERAKASRETFEKEKVKPFRDLVVWLEAAEIPFDVAMAPYLFSGRMRLQSPIRKPAAPAAEDRDDSLPF